MENKEPTTKEILEAINTFSSEVDKQFAQVKGEIGSIKSEIGSIKGEIGSIKSEIGSIKSEIGSIKSEISGIKGEIGSIKAGMVTKDYLDSKLFDLRGDIISVIRKEDAKMAKLINILQKRDIINSEDVKIILSMEPFPQLFI